MSDKRNNYSLGDLCAIKHGYAFQGIYFSTDSTYPTLLTPGNFAIGGGFQQAKPKTFTGVVPRDYVLNTGDLVVTMTDLSKAGDTLGYSALIPETGTYLHNQRVGKVEVLKPDLVDLRYLAWIMRTQKYRSSILGSSTGSAVKHTSPIRILEYELDLPDLSQQKVIAQLLDSLSEKIEVSNRLSKTLEDIAQTIFKSWFIDFDPVKAKMAGEKPVGMDAATAALFPDSIEDSSLGLIPKGWHTQKIGEILDCNKATIKASEETESRPYVPIDQISSQSIFLRQSAPGSEARTSLVSFLKNDILFGAMRPYFHKVVLAPFDGTTRTTTLVLRPKNEAMLSFALFSVFQNDFVSYATNNSQGTTIPYAVWNQSLEDYLVITPNEVVAKAFNDIVLPLVNFGYELIAENSTLIEIRDSLLPRLISGELQIPEEMLAS